MGEQVRIADVQTVERLRASLLIAAEAFGLALQEAEGEVDRTQFWVEGERRDHWTRQIRKSQEAVVVAKSALFRKQEIKATPEARPSVVDEKRALDRARARLELCERKLVATRQWAIELPRQAVIFKGALSPMHTLLDRDLPRVNAMLKRMTEHLEEYLRGGEETEQLLEILGLASMKRGGEETSEAPTPREVPVLPETPIPPETLVPPKSSETRGHTMSVSGSRAKLKDSHRQLLVAWQRANESWDDPVSQALWRNYLEPLEATLRSALNAMDLMNETLERVKRDCGDEP